MGLGNSKVLLRLGKRGFLVIVLVVALVGTGVLYGVLGVPSVAGVDNEFASVTDQTTGIETALVVDNPNPIGISAGNTSVEYTVRMNDVTMANGSRGNLALGKGNTTLRFSTRMRNDKIPEWWVTHIRNGEKTTLRLQSTVHSSLVGRSVRVPYSQPIETDIIGEFNSTETRPVNASVPLVSDPVLYVNETSANWGAVTSEETPIRMRMRVYNPKSTAYTVSEIGYDMTMNGIAVGNGTTDRPYTIPGKSEKTLRMRTIIRNDRLDDWWVSHLENGQKTDLKISFYANIELPNGDTIRVPLRQLTYEKRIETHIFENDSAEGALEATGNASAGPVGDETSTPMTTTAGKTETSAADDDTTTATATSTDAESATTTDSTATGTTTDDGGILGDVLAIGNRFD
ncbi:LEA type 2 family protein [Haladaptatus sp. DYF46]|uniref:LEA type 2 family protein n=1 Tax=Haladaptatus sp. DYF46 TaxID=2886041 RepID=UPI001E491A26|nr:LEA type 2 family protein [Haladaptatus sp. DYF46]